MMAWFDQIKAAFPEFYPASAPGDVVGYLRGSVEPAVWQEMEQRGRHQMLILGNTEPTREQWSAAGVGDRGMTCAVTTRALAGYIVLYGGFILRPWGQIHRTSPRLEGAFATQISSWQRNKPRRP